MANRLSASVLAERKAKLAERGITVFNECYKNGRLWWDVGCRCGNRWSSSSKDLTFGQGCGLCASDRPLINEEAIRKVEALMPGKFLFLEAYRSTKKSWKLQCRECGWIWEPLAGNIVFQRKGRTPKGCPVCAKKIFADKVRLTLEEVTRRLAERGISLLSRYRTLNEISKLRCMECGKTWECKIADIIGPNKCDCPECTDYGFKPNQPAVFYYVRLIGPDGQHLWKVGISNRSTRERLYLDRDRLDVVLIEDRYPLGALAKAREQEILRAGAIYRYQGPKFMRGGGEQEIFTRDVLSVV
jgi:rubrerythrin